MGRDSLNHYGTGVKKSTCASTTQANPWWFHQGRALAEDLSNFCNWSCRYKCFNIHAKTVFNDLTCNNAIFKNFCWIFFGWTSAFRSKQVKFPSSTFSDIDLEHTWLVQSKTRRDIPKLRQLKLRNKPMSEKVSCAKRNVFRVQNELLRHVEVKTRFHAVFWIRSWTKNCFTETSLFMCMLKNTGDMCSVKKAFYIVRWTCLMQFFYFWQN